jgi:hypothetical protein
MILELTIDNLLKSGCNVKDANELFNRNENYTLQCNEGNFYVCKSENRFYTGTDFYRKTCFENGSLKFPYNCPDLIPDYFDLALEKFLETQKTLLGSLYNEINQRNNFISLEVNNTQQRIETQKEFLLKMKHHKFESKENDIQICDAYIQFLKTKSKEPQQFEAMIWESEHELRQFIDLATRWQIETVYKSKTENNPYSIFDDYIKNSRNKFELFSSQLNKKLTESTNWKAIEIDLHHRFLPMLNQYIDWYDLHKKQTVIFAPYNPYEIMFSVIESTKTEILKYSTNTINNQIQVGNNNNNNTINKELHNHIFKNNAFDVWQSMFDEFQINDKSRTDVKFMFEEMKKEGLIHNTVNQVTFLAWITSTYNGLIVEKISNHNRTNVRLQAYSRAKQLYNK